MEKHKLALFPLFLGIAFLAYSFYSSYPLSIGFPGDLVFNHVSLLYWVSLPLILTSLHVLGAFSKSQSLKYIIVVATVAVIYSLSYFYYSSSTSDSIYTRGLTEYFIKTKNLDPSQFIHEYFQWPSFFLLADITTSVSGLELINFEFLLYAIIGSLLAIALYVYAYKLYNNGAFLAVAAFFIPMFNFLNYQAVPFSLALTLLFILFMLETRKKSAPVIVTMLILFFSISITHLFVAVFFVIYLLFRSLINRSKQYAELCLMTAIIYLLSQFTYSIYWMGLNIANLFRLPTEYSSMVAGTLTASVLPMPIDTIAVTVSRAVTITVGLVCFVGFIFLLTRRRLRAIDGAIFLTGVAYSALGLVLSSLGSRAISIFFIPVSLGVVYLFETRFRSYLMGLFLILLMLFVFVPIRASFQSYPITFQTKEDLATANFMIEKYDWNSKSIVVADSGTRWYIVTQIQGSTEIDTDLAPRFMLSNITMYDSIVYSVGLAESLNMSNISVEATSQRILDRFDVVYNSGFSYIATKSR